MKTSIIIPITREKKAQKTIASVKNFQDKQTEIILIKSKGLTPGAARNKGAKKAKGDYLLFLDDDCLADKNWLEANLKALTEPRVGAVGGRVLGKSKKYFSQAVDFSNFTFAQSKKKREMPVCGASFGIKQSIFKKAGGFNKKIKIGEDTHLCMRLRRLGYKTVYEPKIKVLHCHGRHTLKQLLLYQYNNGRVKGLMIENQYPDNLWFKFLKRISYPLIYWLFILPFAILAVLAAVFVNLKDNPKVVFYSPGIFLGKLACQIGCFVWVMRK